MKSAQKIKIIPMLLLLWALPISTLPRATAVIAKTTRDSTSKQNNTISQRSPVENDCH